MDIDVLVEKTPFQKILKKWIILSSLPKEENLWQILFIKAMRDFAYKNMWAVLTTTVGTARFSFFSIKSTFVPIGLEFQPREPRRRPAHLFADSLQGYAGAAFDD